MSKSPAPSWRIRAVRAAFVGLVGFVAVQGLGGSSAPGEPTRAPARLRSVRFREVSREVGIDFVHRATRVHPLVAHIEPQIAATGAAVSVTDVDGDGWPDLYATTSAHGAPNALYRNRGDGTFEDVAAQAGLADLNREGRGCSMGSVWADYDGDGRQDVLVYMWGRSRLFRNRTEPGGAPRFEDVTERAGLGVWANSNAATWLDYDRDGHLDLYLCGYFPEQLDLWDLETTRILHDSFEFARNGGRNHLFQNRGDGTFEDVTEALAADSPRWTYAALAADLDRDGWTDLYLANDYGVEELLLNRGGRRFERAEGVGLEHESKSGMCVALGNVDNDGRPAVFVTNISKRGYLFQGNNLRVSQVHEGGGFVQVARGAVADCGWAWGAQFGDLDHDGWQDLVVVNGFVSASRERDYWYQMSKIGLGTGELVADAAHWPPFEDRSLSGHERTRVLFHSGLPGARYVEAGREVGLADELDGRAVARADLDRDGDLDVVIANQRGPLRVYRNESRLAGRWLALELVASHGHRDALGAEVAVTGATGTQVQVVTAASGFAAQNDRRLHFGLGEAPGELRVRVRWPSGLEQSFDGLALDRAHVLVEGAP